jgi:predicted phosphoadenosine phosphosulfate sulfurtransferase
MFSGTSTRIKRYISQWEKQGYKNGIPDESDSILESFNLVPSYRLICMTILKNDTYLTSLGFTKPVCKVYNEIKRKELTERGKIKVDYYQSRF